MPGDPGATVVTTLVCYLHTAHEAAGATGTRHSPRPLRAKNSRTTRAHRAAGARRYVLRASHQYGGFFFSRWVFAASTHQARSSAKRGNAASSALPPSPSGLPSADKICAIGPTAIVLEITTMPISESVPCHAIAARAPEIRPAEKLAIAAGRENHSSSN